MSDLLECKEHGSRISWLSVLKALSIVVPFHILCAMYCTPTFDRFEKHGKISHTRGLGYACARALLPVEGVHGNRAEQNGQLQGANEPGLRPTMGPGSLTFPGTKRGWIASKNGILWKKTPLWKGGP